LIAVYLGLLVPALFVVTALVGWAGRHQRRVLAARLHDYTVYGWLKSEHIPYFVNRRERATFRRQAKALGPAEVQRVRALQRAGVDLGTLRDRLVRGAAGDDELPREAQLISSLRDLLARVVLPDGQRSTADIGPARSSW
jgi:hypothetical protein